MIKVYSDAATRHNPGLTGLGVLIVKDGKQTQLTGNLQHADNHEGEFAAAKLAFTYLKDHFATNETILFYTDSRLLSDAIGKNYAKHYEKELAELTPLLDYFQLIVTQWVPDQHNHGAHHLANEALHQLE
ncbi:MAG TPA: ribonuclease HI family protein [Candidatus Limosilactobacillus merdigallinarum]|uniref:Ribonuclease HI family protein n=1 Tax=Candidatus Limosilactobacillus merdigallinarum TaxID=2838652 RepID=A0A9D2AKR5_9LACO|nr:ribonuclease HI family protein [Candidatus Limosilactobacillus merdigallinarum]